MLTDFVIGPDLIGVGGLVGCGDRLVLRDGRGPPWNEYDDTSDMRTVETDACGKLLVDPGTGTDEG